MGFWVYTAREGLQASPEGDAAAPDLWLTSMGYEDAFDATSTQGCVCLYANRRADAPWYYIVEFLAPSVQGDRLEYILLPGFPDWLAFLRDYGAALSTAKGAAELDLLRQWARKTFRATHGHAPHLSCLLCDPVTFQGAPATRYRPGLEAGYGDDEEAHR